MIPFPPMRKLTKRQVQVVELLADDLSVKAISAKLRISLFTARSHVRSIALLIPNPHNVPAERLVREWSKREHCRARAS